MLSLTPIEYSKRLAQPLTVTMIGENWLRLWIHLRDALELADPLMGDTVALQATFGQLSQALVHWGLLELDSAFGPIVPWPKVVENDSR